MKKASARIDIDKVTQPLPLVHMAGSEANSQITPPNGGVKIYGTAAI